MASTDRTETPAVDLPARLQEKPYSYDFFHAIRSLECLYRNFPRVGTSLRSEDDPVRLHQEITLSFAPSTLAAFTPRDGGVPGVLSTYAFGAFGVNGPLPFHLTEYADQRRRHHNDPTMLAFLNLFHHRLLSLFYRSWAESNPTVSYDRPDSFSFARYIGSTFGDGGEEFQNRDEMPDLLKYHFAGVLSSKSRNPSGLQAILAAYFQVPVAVEEFVGHWLDIPEEDHCRIGNSAQPPRLGMSAVIGSSVWDCQSKFRIRMGPLSRKDFRRMLPCADSLKKLLAIVKNYIGDEMQWDLNLVLKKEEVRGLRLGDDGYMGWNTWLGVRESEHDADELHLQFN
jgi:type VI secretion system protein ImpH